MIKSNALNLKLHLFLMLTLFSTNDKKSWKENLYLKLPHIKNYQAIPKLLTMKGEYLKCIKINNELTVEMNYLLSWLIIDNFWINKLF